MAQQKQSATTQRKAVTKKSASRAKPIAARGIYSAETFANVMSALMTDVLTGAVEPQVANAVCNSGGKLLKVVELQRKCGGQALKILTKR